MTLHDIIILLCRTQQHTRLGAGSSAKVTAEVATATPARAESATGIIVARG
jgi:hypothetical protein